MVFDLNNPRIAFLYGFFARSRSNQEMLLSVVRAPGSTITIDIGGEKTDYSHEECQLVYAHLLVIGMLHAATTT